MMRTISKKNQITIPSAFMESLGSKDGEYFSDEILADLIDQGYSGKNLLAKFKEEKQKAPEALAKMVDESKKESKELSMEELFGDA